MSGKPNAAEAWVKSSGAAAPTWWLLMTRELADLWIGGKALTLILVYSSLLGIVSFVTASNSELSIIPPKEMVFEMLKLAISVGAIISLIIAADSISGERERATLESLLLTPTSRRQIVLGKYLAAISPWPIAFAMTIPYWQVLAQGDEVFRQAVLWGGVLGTVWAPALAGLGLLVSLWSSTNKTSYFVGLGTYVVFLVPAQLPGTAQTGATGQFLQRWNPMAATNHFLAKILVNNRTLDEFWPWLAAPVLLLVLVLGLLFWYASPRLRLEGGIR
jgi:ABC-type Na+ efflux pump permease subunit